MQKRISALQGEMLQKLPGWHICQLHRLHWYVFYTFLVLKNKQRLLRRKNQSSFIWEEMINIFKQTGWDVKITFVISLPFRTSKVYCLFFYLSLHQKDVCSISLAPGVNGAFANTTVRAVESDGGNRVGPVGCPGKCLKRQKRCVPLSLKAESAEWRRGVRKVSKTLDLTVRKSSTTTFNSKTPKTVVRSYHVPNHIQNYCTGSKPNMVFQKTPQSVWQT